MFWSKIWLFVVTLLAMVAVTIALVLPRPAQRTRVQQEHQRLVVACDVVNILLGDNARTRLDLVASFAQQPDIIGILDQASGASEIDQARNKAAHDTAGQVKAKIEGAQPDFAILLDRRGRVVARVGIDDPDFGDTLAGRGLVDDALAGYLRDDLWVEKNRLYLVSGSPVVKRDAPSSYVVVILGHALSQALADQLVSSLDVNIGFYVGGDQVASSSNVVLDREGLEKALPHGGEPGRDCQANPPFNLQAGSETYAALISRLPGEALHENAFYTVFIAQPKAVGFAGTLDAVRRDDLSLKNFPWILVAVALVLGLGVGVALLIWEGDRPLKRLAADAVRLAKGEKERLGEDEHHGKFGSIARSVNIHVDKLMRDAKAAKKDLDQLLGPAPEGSLGALDLIATPLPAARPGGGRPAELGGLGLGGGASPAFAPPPPSEFRFGDAGPARGANPPAELDLPAPATATPAAPAFVPRGPVPARPTPPPVAKAPPPRPAPPVVAAPRARGLDEDILSVDEGAPVDPTSVGAEPGSGQEDAVYRGVFDQFVELKKQCGESLTGLTFAKFGEKLRKNRAELVTKTGCRDVKFTVYIKDGKAALKATPVKDA